MTVARELPDEVKTFIVQRLACWDPPSAVANAVNEEFDLKIKRQNVQRYDPTVKAGTNLSKQLKELFARTREEFTNETASIGSSHKAVRVRALDRMARAAEEAGNPVLAAKLLEQIAREMGGAFTNRRELSGPGGAPLRTGDRLEDLTDEELMAIARLAHRDEQSGAAATALDEPDGKN